jgi:hypothetical protein
VDVEPDGIAAEEGGGLVVRELDAVVANDEERLGCGGEEALRIEACDRRGGILLDQLLLRVGGRIALCGSIR